MVVYLSLFFTLEDGPVLFVLFLWSSSCHLAGVSSGSKGTTPIIPGASCLRPPLSSNASAQCSSTSSQGLPSMCPAARWDGSALLPAGFHQAGRWVGRRMGRMGRTWGSSASHFHDGAPSRDSESKAQSKENRAPLKSSQTLTLTRGWGEKGHTKDRSLDNTIASLEACRAVLIKMQSKSKRN